MTVTYQWRAWPSCQGTNAIPLGHFLSDLNKRVGSLVTGILADAQPAPWQAFQGMMTRHPVRGCLLQMKLWTLAASIPELWW